MFRGTTPSVTIELGTDPAAFSECYVTFSQLGRTAIERSLGTLEKGASSVSMSLTQEETLALKADVDALVQVRARDVSGNALASNVMRVSVERILKEGVI